MYNDYSFTIDVPPLCPEDHSAPSGGIINFAMDNSKYSSMLTRKPRRKNGPRVAKLGRTAPRGPGGSTKAFGTTPRLTKGGLLSPQTPSVMDFRGFVHPSGLDHHSREISVHNSQENGFLLSLIAFMTTGDLPLGYEQLPADAGVSSSASESLLFAPYSFDDDNGNWGSLDSMGDLSPLALGRIAAAPTSFVIPESSPVIPRARELCSSKLDIARSVAASFRDARLSPTELMSTILTANCREFEGFRAAFYAKGNEKRLHELLDTILADDKGAIALKTWMEPRAIDLVCDKIHSEMDAAKPALGMNTDGVTLEFIETWDVNAIMDPIGTQVTPTAIDTAGNKRFFCSE